MKKQDIKEKYVISVLIVDLTFFVYMLPSVAYFMLIFLFVQFLVSWLVYSSNGFFPMPMLVTLFGIACLVIMQYY